MADYPVPAHQWREFERRMIERLGVNPDHITPDGFTWETMLDSPTVTITWESSTTLPVSELAKMFNDSADVPGAPNPNPSAVRVRLRYDTSPDD